jgi:crotonobetainyl-CoA:carnitine CoA-transferase CaiB-like acyl-CoA transferase
LAASFLADMGADVNKVEPLSGEPYLGLGAGIGSARVNAGKRSLTVDLK